MRIITLRAENVKRLRAVEITPDGDVVVIAGRNAQGKSSVLDAIWMALAGASGAKETSRPIRDGEEEATVELDLGDLRVKRRWSANGTTLEVSAQDGARYSSPQTLLDGLIGRLSFDPLEFAEQDARMQRETLLSVLDLPFDPELVSRHRVELYNARTDVNRELKRLEAILSGLPKVPDETPEEELVVAEIASELQAATDRNAARNALEARLDDVTTALERIERERDQLFAEKTQIRSELEAAAAFVEIEPIRERLYAADSVNEAVRAKREWARYATDVERLKRKTKKLSKEIEELDGQKAKAIAEASMPLPELSFDDEGVLYNGVPFSQASASERLRVGIAMAMALNPKIRVIRLTDGSLLDSANLALIAEMAGQNDFQVWIERVDETGTVGITIEDGMVAEHQERPA